MIPKAVITARQNQNWLADFTCVWTSQGLAERGRDSRPRLAAYRLLVDEGEIVMPR